MAKSKVVKDALVEEEKITKSKKKEEKEEIKEVKVEEKKQAKKEKKEKVKREKKDGYFKKLYRELRKVSWPTLGEVLKYSFAVIIFCVILVLFFELVSLLASFIKSVV